MKQPDEDLVRRMRAGREEAFTELYRRWQGPVYRFALHMTADEAAAEDVTQEAFLLLLRRPASFDPGRGSLGAWLIGVARNLARRWRARALFPAAADPANGGGAPDGRLEEVRRALGALPPHYREVVALVELEEMSYEDAARALECPVGTVRSRLARARALLAERLRARVTGCTA